MDHIKPDVIRTSVQM